MRQGSRKKAESRKEKDTENHSLGKLQCMHVDLGPGLFRVEN